MNEPYFNQDLNKPLILENDDSIDICNSSIGLCSLLNRMIYEYNKPHNRIEDITLTGFPDKWVYNNSVFIFITLLVLCFIPFLGICSLVLIILLMQDVKKKHYEITKIIKKPWKNMLIVKNIPMPFSFATFTKKNLNRLYDDVPCCFPVGQLDSLHNKIEKELLERPIVTICSSVVKNMYKGLNTNSAINISIFFTFMSTGFTLAMMVLGIFFS